MSVYPFEIDDDSTILRVDDNITEIAGQNFNQVRDAVFKIQLELGIKPAGTNNNLREFLEVSHNQDGTLKQSALSAIGLVTLPIDNAQVGLNAGIAESKLNLDYSTNTLKMLIEGNAEQICNIRNATDNLILRFNKHLGGGPEADLRHVLSHIDINDVPFDSRDVNFTWDGLIDTTGSVRPASHLGEALEQINDELVNHQLATDPIFAHSATGISIDASNFSEIPADVTNVQQAIDELDALEETRLGIHRAIMHSQGIPSDARSSAITKPDIEEETGPLPDGYLDGYGDTVVPLRQASTFLAANNVSPIDSTLNGDDVIQFTTPIDPEDVFKLDSEFSLVRPGHIARINYGDGLEAMHVVESTRFLPGVQWAFRINGNNLANTLDAYVRIDKPNFDTDIWGIAATAVSNAFPTASFSGFLGSVIVSDPRSAVALGNGFDPNQLDEDHYLLHLEIYPNGNPKDKVIRIPGIDVTGNQGTTPGLYTLESVVQAANNGFRAAGVNARFIAFAYKGNFGITMADSINGVSFAIVSGERSGSSVVTGPYANNVIGDTISPEHDALGLGVNGSDFASPAFSDDDFVDSVIALKPTKVIMPRRRRFYVADGSRRDFLRSAPNTDNDLSINDFWAGTITDRITVPGVTVKTEYTIFKDLRSARLFPGKTLTVQPLIDFDDPLYKDADYGRFILESIQYESCPGDVFKTVLTVINGVHANPTSNPTGPSTGPVANLEVAIHFDNSSVGFSQNNMVDQAVSGNYHRLHEIYATGDSTTFSHERLRMPVQVPSLPLLGTANWRVRGASPKLRGFSDGASLNRFVRMYILDYDSVTGEYDGYIGRRSTSTSEIFDFGPITKGSKNTPVRFYDNTGVDYIEVEYLEGNAPTTVLAPAYVDIAIFPSLELDDELLLLATCEVNWQNPSTQIVERLIDRRPIGSTSELEFTQSAKSFITAGDRFLHTNGVFRGFESFGINPNDSSMFVIGGGTAIVNGVIVKANHANVKIPQLVESTLGNNLDWAICVNESGNYVAIPLTASKQHFFAEAGTGGGTPYFIPSATFSEIINERKDLLLLYVLNVTISSVVINSISDARKSSLNESGNITLTLSDSEELGSFTNFDQIITWANKLTSDDVLHIKIRGNVTIDITANLVGVQAKIILEDGGGIVIVNTDIGLRIKDNVEIRGVKFRYNHVLGSFNSDSFSHLSNQSGCITLIEGSTNCIIDGCEFRQGTTGERNPYIILHAPFNTADIENITISNCIFYASSNPLNCAIGFSQTGNPVFPYARTLIKNIHISDNTIYGRQSILITGPGTSFFKGENVVIRNNFGPTSFIGIRCASANAVLNSGVGAFSTVYITKNHCAAIFAANNNGKLDTVTFNGAKHYIEENVCRYISLPITSSFHVLNNNVVPSASAIDDVITTIDGAIVSYGSADCVINGNIIGFVTTAYSHGILLLSSGTNASIKNNQITRAGTIDAFIDTSGVVTGGSVIIANNTLSHTSNDTGGIDFDTIKYTPAISVVSQNINHLTTTNVDTSIGARGQLAPGIGIVSYIPTLLSDITSNTNELIFLVNATSLSNSGGVWRIMLQDLLPPGAKFRSFSYNARYGASGVMENVSTQIEFIRNSVVILSVTELMPIALTNYPVILSGNEHINNNSFIFIKIITNTGGGSSSTGGLTITNPNITYSF